MTADERRARASWHAEGLRALGRKRLIEWEEENPETQERHRSEARAIRASDEAAGMVLVPREATERMIRAGANAQYPMGPAEVWRAMIAAATGADNG